jgi:hypothetical protein
MMQLVRTTFFTKAIAKLNVTDVELADLETEIATNPQAGDVIQGLKGVRKIRFAMAGKGKRGGGRCIYLVLSIEDTIYLLLAYGKSKQTDLSQKQRKDILAFIEELE